MNRSDIENYIEDKKRYSNEKNKRAVMLVSHVDQLVTKAIHDFESRTCESCRKHKKCIFQEMFLFAGENYKSYGEPGYDEFSCNKWESKDEQ